MRIRSVAKSNCSLEIVRPVTLQPSSLRREFGEAAPAAADLENALARLHARAFGEEAIFACLGGGKIIVSRREDSRGIGHRVVEPGLVESVAQIVMSADILSRT